MRDIPFYRGDSITIICNITEDGVTKDLSGYSGEIYIANTFDGVTDHKVVGTIAAPETGQIVFTIPNSVTALLTSKQYYEIKYFKADLSDVKTIETGRLILNKTINSTII